MADEAADISNKENLSVVNVNVYAILQVLITIPITSARILWEVHINPYELKELFEKYDGSGQTK